MVSANAMVTLPKNGKQMPKREVYKWKAIGEPGVFMMVNKEDLDVDLTYQRDKASNAKILTIAREFDWRLFGVISVVEREGGSWFVFDGGHRHRASLLRDDIKELPCMVFGMSNIKEEAAAFVGTNTLKTGVKAFDKYKARLVAEEPVAVLADRLVKQHRFSITESSKQKFGIAAVDTVLNMVKKSEEHADQVLNICSQIFEDGTQPPAWVLRGLFYIARFVDALALNPEGVRKLKVAGSDALQTQFNREKHIFGNAGERVAASALLGIVNKRKHKKFRLPESGR